MKLNKKIILASLFALAFASYTFAQVKVSLTIQANVQNAQVYIDDNLAGYASPNLSLLIFPGTYTIRVVKNGYQEYRTTITAAATPITLFATLSGGTPQTPSTPSTPPAPSTPSSPSTPPYSPPYTLPPPITIPEPGFQLSIDANIDGARVYIDNVYVGITPYRVTQYRGGHVIRISAPGYADYVESLYLYRSTVLNAYLSPLPVSYEIRLPDNLQLEWRTNNKYHDKFQAVQLYLDNKRLDSLRGELLPGLHTIAIDYYNLHLEDSFDIKPGQPVILQLGLGVKVY
ncbi:MAG TPA: PEGA domain-containing protein [Rectinema sp.]|jgi:hypothetical protein|nr:PEGA domain-containing protein [Rectinema sp.]HOH05341.1 PEGA domain-containing protein [Rectinema sp.]HPV58885.1 PEGA domain-containing protein [Rectinema sp.]